MIVLIVFDRKTQTLLRCDEYTDWNFARAERLRLELEDNQKKTGHEIVILEAESMDALKVTHGRYFGSL